MLARVGKTYPRRQRRGRVRMRRSTKNSQRRFSHFSKPYFLPLSSPLYLPIACTRVFVNGTGENICLLLTMGGKLKSTKEGKSKGTAEEW